MAKNQQKKVTQFYWHLKITKYSKCEKIRGEASDRDEMLP